MEFVEKYKKWASNNDDAGFKFVRLDKDAEKLVFEEELGGKRIFLKYPETKEDIFFPEGPGWCEDLMQFCFNNNPAFEKILDKMSDLIKKSQKKGGGKMTLKKKKESSEESSSENGSTDDSSDGLSGSSVLGMSTAIKFALSDKEEEDLRDQVSEAKDLLGSVVQIEEDVAGVSMKVKISDVLNPEIANSIGISLEEDIHVLITYERKNMTNVKVSQQGRNENYGIKFFARESIEDFLRDYKGERMSGCSITYEQILAEIDPPKEDQKDAILNSVKPTTSEVTHDKVKLVVAMGFDYGSAVYALQESSNTPEFAVNALMSDINKRFKPSSSVEKHVQEMVNKGFSHIDSYVKLKETNDDVKKAIKLLQGESQDKKHIDLKNLSVDSIEYKLNWVKKKGKDVTKNFYISLYYWFRNRLRNYCQRCVICSAVHKCNPFGTKPVVCSKSLCVFSWENRKLGDLHDTKLCPFMNCEHSVFDPEKFKHLNQALCSQNNSFGVELSFLVEMAQHKYLPYESLLDFITVGAKQNNMQVKKITNVLNPPLCARFERRFKELVESRGKDIVKFQMCYHGTNKNNIDSIVRNGLLVPGKNYIIDGKPLCIGHATDTGWYGKGIYTSPNAGVSLGYCRQGGHLLICSIIMAKMYKCTACIHGAPLMSGYDSHSDPYGNEWIVFDECQVLPCYLVEF